jgi:DNA-directed RNA polymerase subunit RPC12/RpoP
MVHARIAYRNILYRIRIEIVGMPEAYCEGCGEEYRVRDDRAGTSFKCRECGYRVTVANYRKRTPSRRKRKAKSGNTGKTVGLIFTGVISVAALVGIILLVVNSKSEDSGSIATDAANPQPITATKGDPNAGRKDFNFRLSGVYRMDWPIGSFEIDRPQVYKLLDSKKTFDFGKTQGVSFMPDFTDFTVERIEVFSANSIVYSDAAKRSTDSVLRNVANATNSVDAIEAKARHQDSERPHKTEWGPIERVTVGGLEFARRKQRIVDDVGPINGWLYLTRR